MRRPLIVIGLAAVSTFASAAAAQSINIRFGTASTSPSPSYAAAGVAGVWNSFQVTPVNATQPLVSLQGREECDFPDTIKTALQAGLTAERDERAAWLAFQDWRQAYAPHASAIAAHLLCYCPPDETVEASGRSNVR